MGRTGVTGVTFIKMKGRNNGTGVALGEDEGALQTLDKTQPVLGGEKDTVLLDCTFCVKKGEISVLSLSLRIVLKKKKRIVLTYREFWN